MEWQGDPDRSSRPIDWRLRALLIGVPLLMVAALLIQYSEIRPVDLSPIGTTPRPSPLMQTVLSADPATEVGRRELQGAMVSKEFNTALRATMRLIEQGDEGWVAMAECVEDTLPELRKELVEWRLEPFVYTHAGAALTGESTKARDVTYRVLQSGPTTDRPIFPREIRELGAALVTRLDEADESETAIIDSLLPRFFPHDAEYAAKMLDHRRDSVRLLAIRKLGQCGSNAHVPRLRAMLGRAEPDEATAIEATIKQIARLEGFRAKELADAP